MEFHIYRMLRVSIHSHMVCHYGDLIILVYLQFKCIRKILWLNFDAKRNVNITESELKVLCRANQACKLF